jgi:uncharacterized protein
MRFSQSLRLRGLRETMKFKSTYLVDAALAWVVMSLVIAGIDWQDRWHTPGAEAGYFLKLWLYWVQWGLIPLALALIQVIVMAIRSKALLRSVVAFLCLIPALLAIWAGQIEPNLLAVRFQELIVKSVAVNVKPLKIAVVSDMHWGLFVRDHQIQRVINKLSELDADIVLIAGDFTYEPNRNLKQGFSGFKSLKMPVLAVLGNHDVEKPGPKLQEELRSALLSNGVRVIEGQSLEIQNWRIVGLDDLWGGHPQKQIEELFSAKYNQFRPTLVLAHQPDTMMLLPANSVDLAIAGHTHGGQIVLPILTNIALRGAMRTTWYDGLYETPAGQLWVSTGTGLIGLPFRFRMPPRIDVLTIKPF